MKVIQAILILSFLFSCNQKKNSISSQDSPTKRLELKYAEGFSVDYYDGYKIIRVSKPWPNAQKVYLHYIAHPSQDLQVESTDNRITNNLKRLVVTSTTHIPALELLGVESTLVGFPGADYISSHKTRKRIDKGDVRELGKNEGLNTEVLLELQPDVVIGFGVEGVNKSFETIKKAGIPVIYNGDWVESSPLAKAEWIKFFGVLFNKEQQADSIFNNIERSYLEAKTLAQKSKNRPTVMSGAMHKDVWYLPSGDSPEAQFLNDANFDYLWKDTTGNGSLALSFEVVFEKAQHAKLWLSPSYFTSLNQLEEANTLYTNFKAFEQKSIYTFSKIQGATGGVMYYETGISRPDIILKDLIKIGHPELLTDYTPYFFKPLD